MGLAAILGGLVFAPIAAEAQPLAPNDFVPDDRLVTDPSINLPNPAFDQIANLMIWQDDSGNVWLANIDPISGDVSPHTGMGKLLDTKGAPASITGNTAMFADGDGLPAAVWSRTLSGALALGEAAENPYQIWTPKVVANAIHRWKPEGTHENWIGPAAEAYNYGPVGSAIVAWRGVGKAASEGTVSGVIPDQGGRWVEGENALIVPVYDQNGIKQIATVDLNQPNPQPVQVTFESEDTFNAYSWIAPEFNAPVFSAMIGSSTLGIFRKTGPTTWEKYYQFSLPSTYPYLSSPEGFVWNGKSYIFAVAMQSLASGGYPYQPVRPSQVWIAGIDPQNPFFRRIDDPSRNTIKAEPEVFYTAKGPEIYYGEYWPSTRAWVQRLADTGLGTHWGYDSQAYAGPWAAVFRDNKNCSCTPFPVGDSYRQSKASPLLANQQLVRDIMGPDGTLYAALQGTDGTDITAYNTATAAERFAIGNASLGGNVVGNGLVASNGDVFAAGNTMIARYAASGGQLWTAPVRGTPPALQYAPDGNLMAFTYNGWFQVFDPSSGQLLGEQNLTPGRSYPPTPACLQGLCAFPTAPAMAPNTSRIFQTYAAGNGTTTLRSYRYDAQSHSVSLAWQSPAFTGKLTAPVLSADYSRVYFQSMDGMLYAYDAATGAQIWSFDLGVATGSAPVVSEFGYILPGMLQSNSPTVNYVGILKDNGSSANWAFKTTDFASQSMGAVGRGNRFVLLANRTSDGAPVLLVVNPDFGVLSQTAVTLGPQPSRSNGVVLDQNGVVYVGTSGGTVYLTFTPSYATSLQ